MTTIEGYKLSLQQERVWILQQTYNTVYYAQGGILIEAALDEQKLTSTLTSLIDRHESLRTIFRMLPGMFLPLQVITDTSVPALEHLDLSQLTQSEQEARLNALMSEDAQRSIDFEQTPLLHTILIRFTSHTHMLFLSIPALCADAFSLHVITRDFAAAYTDGMSMQQIEAPMQYADFASWQQQLLEAEESEPGRTYWQKQDFSGLLTLKLPFEKKTDGISRLSPQPASIEFSSSLYEQAATFVHSRQTSLSTFLQTCWYVLLWRLTGQTTITQCSAFHGRNYEELESAIGLFTKYIPLTCLMEKSLTFEKMLALVHTLSEEHDNWQEYFNLQHITGQSMQQTARFVYPICFDYEESFRQDFHGTSSISLHTQQAHIECYKLLLFCQRNEDNLSIRFFYDTDAYSGSDIIYLGEQFHALVQSALKYPEKEIGALDILSTAQRHQLIVIFNQTSKHYLKKSCIHQLFEAQVQKSPTNLALVAEAHQLTYEELNKQANQLAHHLLALGIGKGSMVGVCIEQSVDAIIALLGILKAGGAYVPLNPTYPQERLGFLIEDIQASIVLTRHKYMEKLPSHCHTICVDTDAHSIMARGTANPAVEVKAEDLAYVIYTSGSTGQPKGVMIQHRGAVNTLLDLNQRVEVANTDSILALSELGFDLSVYDIFGLLAAGGKIVIPAAYAIREPSRWASLITNEKISIWNTVPALLNIFVDYLEQQDKEQTILSSLRLALLSGDWLPLNLPERIRKLAKNIQVISLGGATEASIWSILYPIGTLDTNWKSIPYGRPMDNQQFYILDEHLQPCPLWITGELYIGGDGVALGYLNRPLLTANQFIPNPFNPNVDERLYKTGDLGRYWPDGTIEFLGRTDHQTKIRGFRIDLGEIDAVLMRHTDVRETISVVQGENTNSQRIVTYIVSQRGITPTEKALREHLQKYLPAYMLPSSIQMLGVLPLTANGKIDRDALPTPAMPEENYVAPRTPIEAELAAIWKELLGLERVGVFDNFFEIGGHSLLLVQFSTRVQETFLVEVPLQQIFEALTIDKMTNVIATLQLAQVENDTQEELLQELNTITDSHNETV